MISAIGSIATPLVVVGLGLMVSRRQSRNDELLKTRIDYYRILAPDLNTLMCYVTFIGTWRDHSPVEIIRLKRTLDQNFYCAAPLFSDPVRDAYTGFEKACFKRFGPWGEDAQIKSGAYRRREAWRSADIAWSPEWDRMFEKKDKDSISSAELESTRKKHDLLIAALVRDLDLTRARSEYTTNLVSLNAHAPRRDDITGGGSGGSNPAAAPIHHQPK